MRLTLSLGLAIAALAALLSFSLTPNAQADARPAALPIESHRATILSDTSPYTLFLPSLFKPHPCRLTPCLVSVETFDDPASGWPEHEYDPGEPNPPGPHLMRYFGGVYQIDYEPGASFRALAAVSPITHPQNTIIDMRARWNAFTWGNGYGLVFGADAPISPTRMYVAVISCLGNEECTWQHAILWRFDSFTQGGDFSLGGLTELTSNTVCAPCTNRYNKWNQVRVIRDGAHIELQVNGETVLEADDATYTGEGYVGVLVENYEIFKQVYAEFDDVTVYDLGP